MKPLTFRSILEPMTENEFFDRVFRREFLHLRGTQNRFSSLLEWDALNSLLRHHRYIGPQLRLVKETKPVPVEAFVANYRNGSKGVEQLSAEGLTRELRDGATLIFDRIDLAHEPVTALAQRLERVFQCAVWVNMYAGWRTTPGFDLHWDDHDVFIFQVAGKKRWGIYGETTKHPLSHTPEADSMKPACPPIWEQTVEAGDLLYIPRGWWHVAVPCDEPTLHLTVGLEMVTGVTFIKWLADRAAQHEHCRADVPLLANSEAQCRYSESIANTLADLCSQPDLLHEFVREMNRGALARPAFALPWAAKSSVLPEDEQCVIAVNSTRTVELETNSNDASVELGLGGKVHTFAAEAHSFLQFILDHEPMTIASFYQQFAETHEREEVAEFLAELIGNGIVSVSGPDGADRPDSVPVEAFAIA